MSMWTNDQSSRPQHTLLARVPETPENTQWEPQRIRVLKDASAQLLCDNATRIAGDAFNFTVKLAAGVQNIKRVAVEAISMALPTTNVNSLNRQIDLTLTAGPFVGPHTVLLTVGQYSSGPALVAELNTQLGPIGFTVTWLPLTNQINISNAFSFVISSTCGFIKYGSDLHGIQPRTTATASLTGEVAWLVFSRYYVISCPELTKYEKNNSSTSDGTNSDIVAFYINNAGTVPLANSWIYLAATVPVWKNFETQTQINVLSFSVRDRWGNDPALYSNSPNSWPCTVIVQTRT